MRELKRKKKVKKGILSAKIKIDAPEFPFPWYLNAIKLQIEEHWKIPEYIKGEKIRQTVISFLIKRNGEILESSIEKSSGIKDFDLKALRAVLNSTFPPLPVGYKEPFLKVHFGFIYEPE